MDPAARGPPAGPADLRVDRRGSLAGVPQQLPDLLHRRAVGQQLAGGGVPHAVDPNRLTLALEAARGRAGLG